jgi:hypothetical protein
MIEPVDDKIRFLSNGMEVVSAAHGRRDTPNLVAANRNPGSLEAGLKDPLLAGRDRPFLLVSMVHEIVLVT